MLISITFIGCESEKITIHEIPKGSEKIIREQPLDDHDHSVPHLHAEDRIWSLPDGWREIPSTSSMRLATIEIDDPDAGILEVAISAFPSDVGGELANVNRWRGQMQLPNLGESELETVLQRFSREGYNGYFTRIDGENDTMIAGGIYSEAANRTWFIRLVASPNSASRLETPLLDFLQSFGTIESSQ